MKIEDFATAIVEAIVDKRPEQAALTTVPNPNGHGQLALVRDGYQIKPLPGGMRRRRTHTFHDLNSFALWLNRHAEGKEKQVEIIADEGQVVADLNPQVVNSDQVTCTFVDHPRFLPWKNIFGHAMPHQQFHQFIRSNRVAFPNANMVGGADSGVSEGDQLAGEVAKLQLTDTRDVKLELDERGYYTAKQAGAKIQLEGKIPARFRISVPLILGIPMVDEDSKLLGETEQVYDLEIFVTIITGDQLGFKLTCPELPITMNDARKDAIKYLGTLLTEGFLVGLGEFKTQDVPALNASAGE